MSRATTLTAAVVEPDLDALVRARAKEEGVPLASVVNAALRRGLDLEPTQAPARGRRPMAARRLTRRGKLVVVSLSVPVALAERLDALAASGKLRGRKALAELLVERGVTAMEKRSDDLTFSLERVD